MAKYLKVNSKKGYIEDTAEIAHVKFNNMRHVILGCMLGDFDNNGEYFVSPEIVAELINMDKHIIESIDNIDICESFLKLDKPITFAITFQNDKATLSLLEKMNHGANFKLNSGAYSDINEYVLAEVETSGAVDKNAVYRMWNVKLSGGSALDVFHMDPETLAKFAGVVRRFKYLLAANKLLLKKEEKIEEIESAYFNKMMEALSRYPKLKVAVEKEIKNQLDEKTGMFRLDKPNAMKTMNEIIEDAIEDNLEVLTEEEQKNFNVEKHNVENEYNIEITKEVDIKTEKIEQKDVNADPIVVPVIETFGEEDKKSAEELAKEFVEEENYVEKRVQDDMVTLATGKKAVHETEKNTEKEESKNLIAESIKGETNHEVESIDKDNKLSNFQKVVLGEIKGKKDANNETDATPGAKQRLKAAKTFIAIAAGVEEKAVVITERGPAIIKEKKTTLVAAEIDKDGKIKKSAVVSQQEVSKILQDHTGKVTQERIKTTQAQVVVADNKTNDKTEEQQAAETKKKNLVANAGNNAQPEVKKPVVTKPVVQKPVVTKPITKKPEAKNPEEIKILGDSAVDDDDTTPQEPQKQKEKENVVKLTEVDINDFAKPPQKQREKIQKPVDLNEIGTFDNETEKKEGQEFNKVETKSAVDLNNSKEFDSERELKF